MDECKPLLLGVDIVVWKDGQDKWNVFEAGAYTRPLLSSTCAVSGTRKYPTHAQHPLAPP